MVIQVKCHSLKRTSRRKWIIAISAFLLLLTVSLLAVYFVNKRQNALKDYQNEKLQWLLNRRGEYDERSIVLSDTSESTAKELANKLSADLRITSDKSFAVLTLPEDVTILDVFGSDEYLSDLPKMSADPQAKISDITASDEGDSNTPVSMRPQYTVTDTDYALQTYLDYLNMKNVWATTRGWGITVAVIDTGIDTDHPEFSGRISEYSYNATEDKIVKDYLTESGSYDWSLIEDEQRHGTAVAGVIGASMNDGAVVGIAPEVTILVIKAECNEDGTFARTSDLVFGLYYAIERDVDVVNMSFGIYGIKNPFAEATQLAYDSNIICVAAAGNDATAALCYPAADDNVIGVGALEADGWELADYSNYGENTDIVAPGSTYTTVKGGQYGTMHGTSMSAPIVTGVMALYLSQNRYTEFAVVQELLYASSKDLGDLGCDTYFGYGALDVSALMLEDKGTVTFNMLTDELDDIEQTFVRNHTLQSIPEPERFYAVFDGWYYDPQCTDEYDLYADKFVTDLTLYAHWVNEDDGIPYTYVELADGTIEIRSYTGRRRYLTIPDYIDGKVVSSIGVKAFEGQTRLREVNLPKYLVRIRDGAFSGCNNLLHINIPQTVTEIGEEAFYNNIRLSYVAFDGSSELTRVGTLAFGRCAKLSRFELPASLKDIDGSAFVGTTSMTAFSVMKGNTNFTAVGGVLLDNTGSTIVCYPAGVTGEYTVPSDVTKIGQYAFAYARIKSISLANVTSIGQGAFTYSSLGSVVIPDSVTQMESQAFAGCAALKTVKLGAGLTEISQKAFQYCYSLNRVEIPANIAMIAQSAFANTMSMTEVTFASNGVLASIGDGAFSLSSLHSVEIPTSVRKIGARAFYRNLSLSSVTFAEGSELMNIGEYAFAGDLRINEVKLPNKLRDIGDFAFASTGLNAVTLPASLSSLGAGAFAACGSLENIYVAEGNQNYLDLDGVVYNSAKTALVAYPVGNARNSYTVIDGTLEIGEDAFYGAGKLLYVTLPEGLTSIAREAFANSSSLQSMAMPDSLTQISNYAFLGDYSLGSVTFGENSRLPRISYGAFAYCGLTSFRVPANVSTMAQGAFEGCTSLTSFTFAKNSKLQSISAYMFDGCTNLTSITFEAGSALTSIQAHGFEGMSKLSSIDFGDAKLTNIDNFAFRFCDSLTSFAIPDGVTYLGRYAFYYCTSLESVTVPESVEYIGRYAFLGTNDLDVYFAAETLPAYLQEDWDHGTAGYYLGVTDVVTDGAFKYAKLTGGDIAILEYNGSETTLDLSALNFGGNIVNIGGGAFEYTSVESVRLPDTTVTIQAKAFYHSALKSISLPASVEFIGREAFADTPIETLTFAKGGKLSVIERSAFENTESLSSVELPASLKQLGRAIFKNSGISTLTFADGFAMTELPREAFAYTALTEVKLPQSVTTLESGVFSETVKLRSIEFTSDAELWIGSNAFYHSGLTSLSIPANMTYIGEYAFVGLSELTEFKVADANPNYKAVDGLLVSKDGRKLIAVPSGRTGTLTLPLDVEMIGFGAFEDSELSQVLFNGESNILSFGYRAFYGMKNIKEIEIPASVVTIDYYAFATCTALEKVTFAEGNRLTGVYEGAFYGCRALKDISLPDSIYEISDFAFYGCRRLTKLPTSENTELKGIYSYGMAYTGLTELTLPESVTDLDSYAFNGTPLTSVTIPDTNKYDLLIGIGAFEDCTELAEITVPFIGASFENYELTWFGYIFGAGAYEANSAYVPESLKKVTITDGITFIGEGAFYNLTLLEEIDVPHSVNTIYPNAFGSEINDKITAKYSLTNTITTVSYVDPRTGEMQYEAQSRHFGTGLSGAVKLSDSVTSINSAFSGCTSLTSVTIPNSVTSIGNSPFVNCSILASITVDPGNKVYHSSGNCIVETASKALIAGCMNSIIPTDGSVTSIGDRAFRGCSSLTSITIPNSVTSIGSSAFYGCTSLYVICNNSDLPITIGGGEYGRIAEHANLIIDKNGNKIYREGYDGFEYIDTVDGFRFAREDGTYKLVAYLGNEDTVTLPKNINGNSYEIYQMTGVCNVIMPDGMTSIGDQAFYNCNSLTSITIPDSVTSIGALAFSCCSSLTNITIPNSVTSVGVGAFSGCSNITSITIPDSVTRIEYQAFSYCSSLSIIKIPNNVIMIDGRAFEHCTNLTSVSIGSGLSLLGDGVFSGCNITDFKISSENDSFSFVDGILYDKQITAIKYVSAKVTEIMIPATVTDISGAFSENKNVKSITFAPGSQIRSIGSQAFYNCSNLASVTIPKSVTSIGVQAFAYCLNLTTIMIPDNVASIGWNAFGGCASLTGIKIPDSVTSIDDLAFSGCSSLTSITIPDSVTSIGKGGFECCSSLKSIIVDSDNTIYHSIDNCLIDTASRTLIAGCINSVIPSDGSVTSIGDFAFHGCSNLTSITIPDSVTSIGDYAFFGCENLNIIHNNSDLPLTIGSSEYGGIAQNAKLIVDKNGNKIYREGYDGFEYIDTSDGFRFVKENGTYKLIAYLGDEDTVTLPKDINGNSYEIYQMRGVRNVIVPDGVTSIDDYAFWGCASLTSITIPDSVTSIGSRTFDGTAYYNNADNWDNGALYIGNHLIKVAEDVTYFTVRPGTIAIASDAFDGCYKLKKLTIGGEHSYVLSNMTNLETLVITEMPSHPIFGYFGYSIPLTLKNIVLADGVRMNKNAFKYLSGVTIYVAAEEKDVRWNENFPGWNNGNRVVYGDKWITADFYDRDNNLISSEIFTTSQVIRQPSVSTIYDDVYRYNFIGWDLDGDGVDDVIPATSSNNISARAAFEREHRCVREGHTGGSATVWSSDGERHWHECSICHNKVDVSEHIPGSEATETTPQTCTVCGYIIKSALGHTHRFDSEWHSNDSTHWHECACGEISDQSSHSWNEGEITKEPTFDEDGTKKFVCTVCGSERFESIDKLTEEEPASGGCRSALSVISIIPMLMVILCVFFKRKKEDIF